VREIGVAELFGSVEDPFVRHHMDPRHTRRAWVLGRAVVVDGTRARPRDVPAGPVFTCLGPAVELAELMGRVAAAVPAPWRLSVEVAAYDAVPDEWRQRSHHRWHWMTTRVAPDPVPAAEVVASAAEVDAVLDVANPDSFARPGTDGVDAWLGLRSAGGGLVGVGAVLRMSDRTGHLRGVSVLPSARGRGLGTTLSAALTARAQVGGSGVATLGVYVDNVPAMAIYTGLGYAVAHTFASGPVRG
jgi:ribosomal protein S18 acetylase RimI-like enzyme